MAKPTKQVAVSMDELMLASLATADALAKLLIEKGVIAQADLMQKLTLERASYQAMLKKMRSH